MNDTTSPKHPPLSHDQAPPGASHAQCGGGHAECFERLRDSIVSWFIDNFGTGEKIQDMLLERIEQVFAKYDETKGSDNAAGNAEALERIARALRAVENPARGILEVAYAAPARTDADGYVCEPTCPCRKTVD